jgi:hypothetical protein
VTVALALLVVALGFMLVWRGEALGWLAVGLGCLQGLLAWRTGRETTHAQSESELSVAKPSGAALLLGRVLPLWSAQLEHAQAELGAGVGELLESFHGIMAAHELIAPVAASQADGLPLVAAGLQEAGRHSENALHALQVGDRVHQLIDVIRLDQRKLSQALATLDTLCEADVERWLADLDASYTTEQQRHVHTGGETAASATGVQFF